MICWDLIQCQIRTDPIEVPKKVSRRLIIMPGKQLFSKVIEACPIDWISQPKTGSLVLMSTW